MNKTERDSPNHLAIGFRPPTSPLSLIIGYGNRLRGDDAVGCLLAEEILEGEIPHARVLLAHQLSPELAAEISRAERVLFLDARHDGTRDEIDLTQIEAEMRSPSLDHAFSPEYLVALTRELYGVSIAAWALTIPAYDFSWREELSPQTTKLLPQARLAIQQWLGLSSSLQAAAFP